MTNFQRILVGVDLALAGDRLTPGSESAAGQAIELAARSGAEVTFLHSTWADIHEENQALRPGPNAQGLAALDQLVARAGSRSVRARLALVRDRAWLEIIRASQRGEADLVLVARQNQAGESAALGGVGRKLLRKCPCPVWVIQPGAAAGPRVIVAATDLSPVGDRAVRIGAWLAELFDAELHAVHAWPLPLAAPALPELGVPVPSRVDVEQLERVARTRFQAALTALELARPPREHLLSGAPSLAIREVVEACGADLLVMGSVSRSGIAGLLLGNTAERLLDRVPCALLTIKPADFRSPV